MTKQMPAPHSLFAPSIRHGHTTKCDEFGESKAAEKKGVPSEERGGGPRGRGAGSGAVGDGESARRRGVSGSSRWR